MKSYLKKEYFRWGRIQHWSHTVAASALAAVEAVLAAEVAAAPVDALAVAHSTTSRMGTASLSGLCSAFLLVRVCQFVRSYQHENHR